MSRLAGLVGDALRIRRQRWIAATVTAGYLVVYLLAIQNLVISPGTDLTRFVDVPSVHIVPDWTSKVFKQIAAFYYEPVAAIYPLNHVTILVSPVNLGIGLLLGALVGTNVAVALHLVRCARACRTRAFNGLLAAIPGFLTGFACCVPTVALVLGAQFTVALIALRSYFFPFALAALLLSLTWNARRAARLGITSGAAAPG
ncbi:MAG: hypothetical protein ACRDHS_14525 [Actinomycetota bacterium]